MNNSLGSSGVKNQQKITHNYQSKSISQFLNNSTSTEKQSCYQSFEVSPIDNAYINFEFKQTSSNLEGNQYDFVCPLCAEFIDKNETCFVFDYKQIKRKFLCHLRCLMEKSSSRYSLVSVPQGIQQAVLRSQSIKIQTPKQQIKLNSFYKAKIFVTHPISDISYYKSEKKIFQYSNQLIWPFINDDPYLPNMICMPYTDLKIKIIVEYDRENLKQVQNKQYDFLVNLNKRDSKKKTIICATTSNVVFQIQIFTNAQQKSIIIDNLTYKYKFNPDYNLVCLSLLKIRVPEEYQIPEGTNSLQKASTEKFITYTKPQSTRNLRKSNTNFTPYSNNSLQSFSPMFNPYIANFNMYTPPLINYEYNQYNAYAKIHQALTSGTVAEYSCTPQGSLQLQTFIISCNFESIQLILEGVYYSLQKLIINQYGNYMFQELIKRCNAQQRYYILEKISPRLPELISDKRGTHSLQALVSLIETQDEEKSVVFAIRQEFDQLSLNLQASYFIEIVIIHIQLQYLQIFYEKIRQNFMKLACNTHGVRIIKRIMKKIDTSYNKIQQILDLVCFNLDLLIQDQFGNYLIQYAFEIYTQDQCKGIIKRIAIKFVSYSIQRISSNVVDKMLNCFKHLEMDDILIGLEGSGIDEMLKIPAANLILQKLTKQCANMRLIEKIQKALAYHRNTKYDTTDWRKLLNTLKPKSETCRNNKEQIYVNFQQTNKKNNQAILRKVSCYTPKNNK